MLWHTVTHERGSEGEKLKNAVGSQYSSHYHGTRYIQHHYRWYHTPRLASSRLNWLPPSGDLNGLVHFARKTKSGFCACVVIFKWTGPFRAKDEIWFLRMCRHVSNAVCHHVCSVTCTAMRWVVVPLCLLEKLCKTPEQNKFSLIDSQNCKFL